MKPFIFSFPTELVFGRDIFETQTERWRGYGKRCILVTGKRSASATGALQKLEGIIAGCSQTFVHYDGVGENPTAEMCDEAAALAREAGCDFVVGVGGGSALDTAKLVSALLKRPEASAADFVTERADSGAPLVCVPTTAGTGSETTPYAVITVGKRKCNMNVRLFPAAAWVDSSFSAFAGRALRCNTLTDAICQNIEGMLSTRSNALVDGLALHALSMVSAHFDEALGDGQLTKEACDALSLSASLSGLVIAQCGISLPHILSYPLTEAHHIPHGRACGLLLCGYMSRHPDKEKVGRILAALRCGSIEALGRLLEAALGEKPAVSEAELRTFVPIIAAQKERLRTFPLPVEENDILELYRTAVNAVR